MNRSDRLLSIAIFLFYFSILTLIMGGHLYSPDEEIMFRTTESLIHFRGFAIEPITPGGDRFTDIGKDGRFYGHYGLGQSLLAVPFYYGGLFLSKILPESNNSIFRENTIQYHNRTWKENITRLAVSRMGQVVTAFTCLLLFHFGLVLGYSKLNSFLISFIYGISTIAFPFSKTFYSEPTATLFLLLAFYNLYRYRLTQRTSLLIWSGGLLGYAIFTRIDTIITIPIFLVYAYLINRKQGTRTEKLIYFLLPLAIFCFLVGWFNFARFGSFTHTGYESEGLQFKTYFLDGLYGLLMSAGKSIFLFSPPILLFFPSIRKFWNKHKEEAIFCCGMALIYILFYSKWESWAGGWTWGPRHVFQIHIFMILPLLTLFQEHLIKPTKSFWLTVAILSGLGIFVQIPGILVSFMDYNFWFQQRQELFYTLYFPIHSSLAGHWQILAHNNVDLFFYQVWLMDAGFVFKFISIFSIGIMLLTLYYISKELKLDLS